MNGSGVLRAVDQQFTVHRQRGSYPRPFLGWLLISSAWRPLGLEWQMLEWGPPGDAERVPIIAVIRCATSSDW